MPEEEIKYWKTVGLLIQWLFANTLGKLKSSACKVILMPQEQQNCEKFRCLTKLWGFSLWLGG